MLSKSPELAIPVDLASHCWGPRAAARQALLIHGLSSTGSVWWQIAEALARNGYRVVAPDLRGHGDSPCTSTYRISDHVADLRELGSGWDLVVGHSLGGLLATAAIAGTGDFAHRALLLDPVLDLRDEIVDAVVAAQLEEARTPQTADLIRASNPHWHPQDAAIKAAALATVNLYATERTIQDNLPWHFAELAHRITVPTTILAGDPAAGGLFALDLGEQLTRKNPNITVRTVAGAGHSVHRDNPAAVIAAL
jgi:pimeloyl-ACP methyl ester carboxylesterase